MGVDFVANFEKQSHNFVGSKYWQKKREC